MSLLGQHARYTASFKPGQAFDPGVPSGELAFENGGGMDIMLVYRVGKSVAAVGGGDIDFGGLERATLLDVVFGYLVGAGMLQGIHD